MNNNINRRGFLKATAAASMAGVATLAAPGLLSADTKTLKIGTYGGFFEDSFKQFIYPEFTKETGIKVKSLAIPTGEAWLVQINNAARAKTSPADVSLMAGVPRNQGADQRVFQVLDESKLSNIQHLPKHFQDRYDDGGLYGCGALSWYITLCTNTDEIPERPDTWAALWDEKYKDQIGLLALSTNSFLLEITATTFFGGTDVLSTREGIEKVFAKLDELAPNVHLWYRDEGAFQQALQVGEIPMGQYYHDVAGLAAAEGFPVASNFPKEGGVLDSGFWVVPEHAKPVDEIHAFIDFMSKPETQALLARKVGTAPVVDVSLTDLSEDEISAVSSGIAPILPRYDIYKEHGDWISDRWSKMIAG